MNFISFITKISDKIFTQNGKKSDPYDMNLSKQYKQLHDIMDNHKMNKDCDEIERISIMKKHTLCCVCDQKKIDMNKLNNAIKDKENIHIEKGKNNISIFIEKENTKKKQ